MSRFAIGDTAFLLDGQPFRVLSGALHYFRIHPSHWRDRIKVARMMGLNTIETYVPWNAHEPEPGAFTATGEGGRLDLVRFLQLVHEEGMYAIVRPGPYICAEWDGGGLPAWLLKDPGIRVRTSDPRFLKPALAYLDTVLSLVAPLQIDAGGPVILVQVENEYGAYGTDAAYLRALADATRAAGIAVPLITVDQPSGTMIADGSLPGLHKTASFGSNARERLAHLREVQPTGPLMCGEFWCGWFDHWGAHHHTTSDAASASELDDLLAAGASVNIYMVHGGTNFGFTNGANDKGVYQPITTSYDYDAPIDEAGRPTKKFWAFRDVIAKYAPVPAADRAPAAPAPTFAVPLLAAVPLMTAAAQLSSWEKHQGLPTMDAVGTYNGFLAYRTRVRAGGPAVLTFSEVRDRAMFFLDGAYIGTLSRERHERALVIPHDGELTILVEDEGRVDYGERIGEHKGLIGPARLGDTQVTAWQTLNIDADRVARSPLPTHAEWTPAEPALYQADFDLATPTDLFLNTSDWGKGAAWINGFPLGRHWRAGPQHTLYVPAGAVRAGRNHLVVLELEGLVDSSARFVPDADLGHTDY